MNKQDSNNAVLSSKHDLYIRPGTYDENIIREVEGYGPLFINHTKEQEPAILDIGGQAGYFTVMAARRLPLAHIFTFEPEPENHKMIMKNIWYKDIDQQRINVYKGAVARKRGKTRFYVNQGKPNSPCINTGLHTLRPTRGRPSIEVQTHNFSKILENVRPSLIKCDIEGGEFYIKEELLDLPSCVTGIAIEIHLTGKTDGVDNRVLGKELNDELAIQFPRVLKGKPVLDLASKNWTTTLIAHR